MNYLSFRVVRAETLDSGLLWVVYASDCSELDYRPRKLWLWEEGQQRATAFPLPEDAVEPYLSTDLQWILFRRDLSKSEREIWLIDWDVQNERKLAKWGSFGTGDGQFNQPEDIAVNGQGYVYVVEDAGNRIQMFDHNGQFLAKWGSTGSGEGQFSSPYDVEVDGQGNIYVSEEGNNRIQKFRQK